MGLETGTYISDLVVSNPDGSDKESFGDNHLRLIKSTAKNTFPNADRAFYFPTGETKTATGNIVAADQHKLIIADAAGGAITLTLPGVSAVPDGYYILIVKGDVSANAVTVAAADSIDNKDDVALTRFQDGAIFMTDGTTWHQMPFNSGDKYKPSQSNPVTLKVRIAAGSFLNLPSQTLISNAVQDTGTISAPGANPRNDIVYIDRNTGVIGVATGTEAASPSDPAIPANKVPVARVRLQTSTSSITNDIIDDLRNLESLGLGDASNYNTGTSNGQIPVMDAVGYPVANGRQITGIWETGDCKLSFQTSPPTGWIIADDGTIGSGASGASNRANDDTETLFKLLWNNVSDTYAPVTGGRGASADADWTADKKIQVGTILGRALGVAGAGSGLTSRSLGEVLGEEDHVLTLAEMPAHGGHRSGTASDDITGGGTSLNTGNAVQGSGNAHNNMQPTAFMNLMIKL